LTRLTDLRRERNLSTNKLAILARVASSTVKKIEEGTPVYADSVFKVARALGVDATELKGARIYRGPYAEVEEII